MNQTMKKVNKEEINQEVFDLYDDYAHNRIDRRQFLDKLSIYAVGGLTVTSLLSFMIPQKVEEKSVVCYRDQLIPNPGYQGLS